MSDVGTARISRPRVDLERDSASTASGEPNPRCYTNQREGWHGANSLRFLQVFPLLFVASNALATPSPSQSAPEWAAGNPWGLRAGITIGGGGSTRENTWKVPPRSTAETEGYSQYARVAGLGVFAIDERPDYAAGVRLRSFGVIYPALGKQEFIPFVSGEVMGRLYRFGKPQFFNYFAGVALGVGAWAKGTPDFTPTGALETGVDFFRGSNVSIGLSLRVEVWALRLYDERLAARTIFIPFTSNMEVRFR